MCAVGLYNLCSPQVQAEKMSDRVDKASSEPQRTFHNCSSLYTKLMGVPKYGTTSTEDCPSLSANVLKLLFF